MIHAKNLSIRISLFILVCLLLVMSTACSKDRQSKVTEVEKAYEPLDPPVTMRIAYSYSDIVLPEGDISDDHFLTRYLKEQTGVTIKYDWESSGEELYENMLDLAIRSNDLPDAFIVNRIQFRYLIQHDMIEDLTSVYPKYSSSLVRSIYEATGGKALEEASVDGKLYAFPNVAIEADAPTYLWIRQDWLDKLDLAPPSTIEEIETIVKAFKERDPDGNGKADTIGIPIDKLLIYEEKNGVHGLNGIFAAYHAFPKSWVRDDSGKVVYGSIQPNAKAALATLAQWYKKGIIDSQFVLRKDIYDLLETNQTGIIFGPWWAPYWPLSGSVSKDTKAEWRVYTAPVDAGGTFITNTAPITDRYLVIRKGYVHPEAALKVLNVLARLERNQDPNWKEAEQLRTTAEQLGVQLRNYYPFDLLLDYPDAVAKRHDWLIQALNKEISLDSLDPETKSLYDDMVQEMEQPRKNLEAWSASQAYLLGGKVSKAPMVKSESLFYDTTASMEKNWSKLQQLEYETYLKIITGELSIEAFDKFVTDWMVQGGDEITREVSAEVNKKD